MWEKQEGRPPRLATILASDSASAIHSAEYVINGGTEPKISGIGLGFRVPLIGESIQDWIQRTLANGPDTEPYFFKEDFIDMGPAMPNATEYCDIKGYFRL